MDRFSPILTLSINNVTIKTHEHHSVFVLKLLSVLWGKLWKNKFNSASPAQGECERSAWREIVETCKVEMVLDLDLDETAIDHHI